jgi:hypothetical protein
MVRHFALAAVSFLVLASPAYSRVWIVDLTGGGDFTRIQDAIDASSDGDVILVDDGAYGEALDVAKNLTIRRAGTQFSVVSITIHDVASGPGVSVGGVEVGNDDGDDLAVRSCNVAVVLEDVLLDGTFRPVHVLDCTNVSITHMSTPSPTSTGLTPEGESGYVLECENSNVRCTDMDLEQADRPDYPDTPAWTAVTAIGSQLVLARCTLHGGQGTDAVSHVPGQDGGAGLDATDSTLTVLGTESDTIQGGDGGAGHFGSTDDAPGDGGPGVRLTNSTMLISREVCLGGKKGKPAPFSHKHGKDGVPIEGSGATRLDVLPHLSLTDDLTIGLDATATVDGVESGSMFLMIADATDFEPTPRHFVGPPLAIGAATTLIVIPMGATDSNGDVVYTDTIPDDSVLVGDTIRAQAYELADSGALYLTNAIDRVIGE